VKGARIARALVPAGLALAAALAPLRPALAATYRDAIGRSVTVAEDPARIVSLAPDITEVLFALGLGDRVVGVTVYCDYPPEALGKPKIGGFINPSLEAILAERPDLVVATADGNRREDVEQLAGLGVAVYVVNTRSLDEIFAAIRAVGRLTGRAAAADALAGGLARRRDRVRAAVANRPPVSVFVALDRNPLVTAGEGTFVAELVELAGGRNVVVASAIGYPVMNMEQLLAADPAVIVDAAEAREIPQAEAEALWRAIPGAAGLSAVRRGRILVTGMGSFFRPGPRVVESLERLAAYLHPGAAPP
jgi:iron complex transport system substrate-binding protein